MIRPGRDEDGAGYSALIAACWGEYPGVSVDVEAEIPEIGTLATVLARRGGAVWAAEQDGKIVGMVAADPADDGWHLSRMYVAASQRGTGLGHDLLLRAEEHARDAGAGRMVLWSDVLFTRAHAFYEKHGYLRRGGLRALHDVSDTIEAGFAKPLTGDVVEELDIAAAESAERPLASMLQACVASGAPAVLLPPLSRERALAYWRGVTRAVGQSQTRLFAGWCNGILAGTVQLGLDMPESHGHRADIRALLVADGSRRRVLARVLLEAAEAAARQSGRRLLVFETPVDEHAEPMYRAWGWTVAGGIPGGLLGGSGAVHDTRTFIRAL